jgi:hypothetical protein
MHDSHYASSLFITPKNQVWAGFDRALLRWNGRNWKVSRIDSTYVSSFTAIEGVSTKNIYALGDIPIYGNHVLHWDGKRWNANYAALARTNYMSDLAVQKGGDAWAVGMIEEEVFMGAASIHPAIWRATKPCKVADPAPTRTPTPTPLAAPQLRVPAAGATVNSLKPVLRWQKIQRATGYKIDIVFPTGVGDGTRTSRYWRDRNKIVTPLLEPGKVYRWRVRACSDKKHCGFWSEEREFLTPK